MVTFEMRLAFIAAFLIAVRGAALSAVPQPAAIDTEVQKLMAESDAKGLALAVIDDGRISYVRAYGVRNTQGDSLRTDTIMYGASLTKTIVAIVTLQLVDAGRISLDTPIAEDLDKPLPSYGPDPVFPRKYGPYWDLANDERWRRITPRMVLTHSTGFANFAFVEPDRKLRIHFEPGSRFAYSGEGFTLLQFAIEHGRKDRGLGTDLGDLARTNIFEPLGMTRTSLVWRGDFTGNVADGWDEKGNNVEHSRRSKVGAAGSMDTTIADMAKFAAALANGWGLSPRLRAEMVRPQLHITTKTMFPTLQPDLPQNLQRKDLFAGLGVVVFDGPQGPAYHKGGHDDTTANTLIGVESHRRSVVILSNDVRSEPIFPDLVTFLIGQTGWPTDW